MDIHSTRGIGHMALVAVAFNPDNVEDVTENFATYSVGTGERGSAKIEIPLVHQEELLDYLAEYDPQMGSIQADSGDQLDIIQSTIGTEVINGKSYVSFNYSEEKNSRKVKVPVEHWDAFVQHLVATAAKLG